jgi:hypothetical protein
MWWKRYGLVLGLAMLAVGASDIVPAGAQGIEGVVAAGKVVKDTVQTIVYMVGSLLVIGGVIEMRHGANFGSVALAFFGVVLIVAIALFSDEIIALIKPGAAAGWSAGGLPAPGYWDGSGQVLEQWGWLALNTIVIRRVRR